MKILIYTDNHWSQYSSVIRMRGTKYSKRLENQIQTLAWINEQKLEHQVDKVICLGDFFDRSELNSEELTALKDIDVNGTTFIVGNHEASISSLEFSSSHLFNSIGGEVIDKIKVGKLGSRDVLYLPYEIEDKRKKLSDIIDELHLNKNNLIILSHNDIKDIRYGYYKSNSGYPKEDILNNCILFINGHIHNGGLFDNKILNLGSITGLNFNNDMDYWQSSIAILDTETLDIQLIKNPHSFNFYKNDLNDLDTFKEYVEARQGDNNIIMVKVPKNIEVEAKEFLNNKNYLYKRLLIDYAVVNKIQTDKVIINMNYLDKFKYFISTKFNEGTYDMDLILSEIDSIIGV